MTTPPPPNEDVDVTRQRVRSWSSRGIILAFVGGVCALIGALAVPAYAHLSRCWLQREIVAKIEKAGGSAYFDYQVTADSIKPHAPPSGPLFVRSLFGDDVFATVNAVLFMEPTATDATVATLVDLPDLMDVWVTGVDITDACVSDLVRIRKLRSLNLSSTALSPDGLSKLSLAPNLRSLTLYGEWVTDQHIDSLSRLNGLQSLQLVGASVSDHGMLALNKVKGLKRLDILSCRDVTDVGILSLHGLDDLEALLVWGPTVTDKCLALMPKLRRLRHLILRGYFTENAIGELRAQLPGCNVDCRAWEADPDESDAESGGSSEPGVGADSR